MNPVVAAVGKEAAVAIAKIGLSAAIHTILGNQKASVIVGRMQAEGRSSTTPEEEAELAAESLKIASDHEDALQRAEAEGR